MSTSATPTPGIHHVTAIASDPQRNVDFYVGTLGMRMVKRTVNFDDPQSYHFYYGDADGTPGTILTFFPWPGARRGRQGTGTVAVTRLSVPRESLGWWLERLAARGVEFETPRTHFGERVVAFQDPDGLALELVADPDASGTAPAWAGGTVPAEHAVRGFHSVALWETGGEATVRLLAETLGFEHEGDEGSTSRFRAAGGAGRVATRVDVVDATGQPRGLGGAGTVHHVAWRAVDDAHERDIRQAVTEAGAHPTEVIDRNYFHSVYFREPGGVLFEIATDPPGFMADEPRESLGERLMLPAQYEPRRDAIERVLPPIHLPHLAARESA